MIRNGRSGRSPTFEPCVSELQLEASHQSFDVEHHDAGGSIILYAAVSMESLELVKFLIDKKGADVNSRTSWRGTPLQAARSAGMIATLLTRGADPTLIDVRGKTPLMDIICFGKPASCPSELECVERLLQDSRVLKTINVQTAATPGNQNAYTGYTALHLLCYTINGWEIPPTAGHGRGRDRGRRAAGGEINEPKKAQLLRLLILAGADPHIRGKNGKTPFDILSDRCPAMQLPLLMDILEPNRTSSLFQARHLLDSTRVINKIQAATTDRHTRDGALKQKILDVTPPYLTQRLTEGKALPFVTFTSIFTSLSTRSKRRAEVAEVLKLVLVEDLKGTRAEAGECKGLSHKDFTTIVEMMGLEGRQQGGMT